LRIIFLDIEASAIGGYPIEVGWAIVDWTARTTETGSFLIRPSERWVVDLPWHDEAERLHGIPLARVLREGLGVAEAARRLNALFAGLTLYSDAPWADGAWLDLLFEAAEEDCRFELANITEAFRLVPLRKETGAPMLIQVQPPAHRAAADAARWAAILLAGAPPQ
jgi:hypothetical protein